MVNFQACNIDKVLQNAEHCVPWKVKRDIYHLRVRKDSPECLVYKVTPEELVGQRNGEDIHVAGIGIAHSVVKSQVFQKCLVKGSQRSHSRENREDIKHRVRLKWQAR